jgi:hypothetical protein
VIINDSLMLVEMGVLRVCATNQQPSGAGLTRA